MPPSASCSASTRASSRRLGASPPDATGPLHALRIVYRARITGGRLRNELDGSTDRAEWFPLSSVHGLQRVKLVDIALRMAERD